MDQPRPKRPGRPRLKEAHVKICGYVTLAISREIAAEAAFRGVSIGDLITEAFDHSMSVNKGRG